jgi:hypothetical protein
MVQTPKMKTFTQDDGCDTYIPHKRKLGSDDVKCLFQKMYLKLL